MPAPFQCLAVTTPGLEAITAAELAALRLTPGESEPGAVPFAAHHSGIYRANLELRTATRVLVRIAQFHAHSFFELERHAGEIPWGDWLPPGAQPVFRVTSRKSKLYHQDAVAERLLAAARPGRAGAGRDGQGRATPERPVAPVVPVAPVLFVVRLWRDELTLSVDASGEALHRRGYRLETAKAPLRETLGAAMLLGLGYDGSAPLIDPFAGSGTIPIEAALIARRMAPGRRRPFAFERWPRFEPATWSKVKHDAEAKVLDRAPSPILGSDRDAGAVAAARANAMRAGVQEDVAFERKALSDLEYGSSPAGWVVTNPPYGVRMGDRRELRDLYARLGQVLARRPPAWRAAILSAHRELERAAGIDWAEAFETTNGGLGVRLMEGGRKREAAGRDIT